MVLGLLMIGKGDGDGVARVLGFRNSVVVQPRQRAGCERKAFGIRQRCILANRPSRTKGTKDMIAGPGSMHCSRPKSGGLSGNRPPGTKTKVSSSRVGFSRRTPAVRSSTYRAGSAISLTRATPKATVMHRVEGSTCLGRQPLRHRSRSMVTSTHILPLNDGYAWGLLVAG